MRRILFLSAIPLVMASAGAHAQELSLQQTQPVNKQVSVVKSPTEVLSSRSLAKGIEEKIVKTGDGLKMKIVEGIHPQGNVLNPELKRNVRKQSSREGFVLYEDFEDWDGNDASWLPDGWTVDHRDSPQSDRGWKITQPLYLYDIIDSKCLTYELFEEDVDEWVMTPQFSVAPGMILCWSTMTSPYFYDWGYFDDKTFQITEFHIVNDIRVNISADGGQTWQTVFSHADDLIEETDGNFFAMFDYTVRPFEVSLDDYVGQNIMVGFQICGHDGNTSFLDNVSIGMPLTGTSYYRPLSNLFFGLSKYDQNVPASIMVGPVFQPVKYTNNSANLKADFTWTYEDTDGEGNVANTRDLSVTYKTDHSSDFSSRNNMYTFPVLEGSSESTALDSYTYPGFYQAGGKGEYEIYYTDTQDREIIDLGLTIVDPMIEGSATYADIAVPYFGYNQESDRYWTEYSFGRGGGDDENWNHLEKVADFFYTPDTPFVIEGARFNAYGKVSRNTKLTAEIYPLNAGFVIGDEPIATAVCTGNDITIVDRYSGSDILSFNFKFDEPVIIDKKSTPYFIVAIGGFRDPENVEYFSPEMSAFSNPNNLGLGWMGHQMMFQGTLLPFSWSSVTNLLGDELVAFYIMLDAYYPWLEGETTEIELLPGSTATVAFDSYHDAKRLTVEGLPEGITASIQGRYDKTFVTFTASEDIAQSNSTVFVKGPGVSHQIDITAQSSGISDIPTADDVASGVLYTIDGRKVSSADPAPGIYILKRADGSTIKFVKR